MSNIELNAENTMKLLLAEALSDKKLDDGEKAKIKILASKLGIDNAELQKLLNEMAVNIANDGSPARPFDPKELFASACDVAMADGVLSDEEKNNLYTMKEILHIDQEDYQSEN